MPNTILIKKSGTAAAVPSSLSYGELALNYADGLLFYKNATGDIVSLSGSGGGGGGSSASNQKLDALTFNGSTTTFNLTASSAAVTPANAASLLISIDGVLQEPGADYTISGSTITFTTAPESTDTFFGVHMVGGSGGGGISDGDKGDITVSASGATWTINANAVADADIAAVSATKLTGTIDDARHSDKYNSAVNLYLWSSFR